MLFMLMLLISYIKYCQTMLFLYWHSVTVKPGCFYVLYCVPFNICTLILLVLLFRTTIQAVCALVHGKSACGTVCVH